MNKLIVRAVIICVSLTVIGAYADGVHFYSQKYSLSDVVAKVSIVPESYIPYSGSGDNVSLYVDGVPITLLRSSQTSAAQCDYSVYLKQDNSIEVRSDPLCTNVTARSAAKP